MHNNNSPFATIVGGARRVWQQPKGRPAADDRDKRKCCSARGIDHYFLILAVTGAAVGLLVAGCGHGSQPASAPPTASTTTPTPALPPTNVRFVDVADQAGLNYEWTIPYPHPFNILQTIGHGCAFLDYNNDGNLDILLVGPKLALYKGDGHGHFTDVTHAMGLDKYHEDFLGCAVGDYDNDGYDDIYLSAYQGGVLLHNEHGKYFKDVTSEAGIKPQPWGSSCAFVDVDNDGKLDLMIGNYVVFGPKTNPQLCTFSGVKTSCGPGMYKANKAVLYRNLGGGKFEDVSKQWGVDKTSGKVLGVAPCDFDGSGYQSIYLANDEVSEDFLKNNGHGFTDIAAASGTAYDSLGKPQGGMGVDWGDYDNDGQLDLVVTTFEKERRCIYHNDGGDLFTEQSADLGVGDPKTPLVAFGVKWIDADNDGWLDLMIANGHIQDNVNASEPTSTTTYRQVMQFYHNEQGQRFTDASAALIGPADRPIVGRGLAIGDFDNDGKMDALVVDAEGKPLLLHNETPNVGHWLEINLIGTKSNRDGLGALITVGAGDQKLLRLCTTAGSYMSASSKRVHFGLGSATVAQTISVHWPSGHVDTVKNVAADQIITLREGDSKVFRG
jgi:hypothetical protein